MGFIRTLPSQPHIAFAQRNRLTSIVRSSRDQAPFEEYVVRCCRKAGTALTRRRQRCHIQSSNAIRLPPSLVEPACTRHISCAGRLRRAVVRRARRAAQRRSSCPGSIIQRRNPRWRTAASDVPITASPASDFLRSSRYGQGCFQLASALL